VLVLDRRRVRPERRPRDLLIYFFTGGAGVAAAGFVAAGFAVAGGFCSVAFLM
jgi:hypothetical protein